MSESVSPPPHPVPAGVRAAASWSWRLLVIGALVVVLFIGFLKFKTVLVPVAIAILGTAMLVPVVDFLNRRRLPRSLAVVLSMVGVLGVLGLVMSFVVREFINGIPELTSQVTQTVNTVKTWLIDGPFKLDAKQVNNVGGDVVDFINHNQEKVTSGALATATTATEIVTGAFLTLFVMIFFLYGGGQIWEFVTKLVPAEQRARVCAAGHAGFGTLVGYVRATVAVALVDAIGIGVGLAIIGVPLALPLASLVFLGAFIPIVGALVTGGVAVLVALVTNGWLAAVIALAIVIAVMQVESHVLQPFLLGRSVRLHPVAVVLAIAGGIVLAGIVGGLLAVPLIAFLNTAIRELNVWPGELATGVDGDGAELVGGVELVAEPDSPTWDTR
ncbi:AI-2E family transporter [Gordonia defluvii]|jgi:predicted PurR-regulated permease PerM|uniref:AI-2E family transporter n=1 Tax=Gordonia defluvii TaxID=283718 RepID=A0ABN3YE42_9ACTN|nr:AI-2E family transporter [Gordonia sp. UBA5067]